MSESLKYRITLWDRTGTNGWRGQQKAVVFDAKSIGIEEYANDSGSAFWTLNNDHPQISEFQPLSRHYEISYWSPTKSRWEFAAAGILNDYQATEYETTFSGIDYKAVFNQYYTPNAGATVTLTTKISPNCAPNVYGSPFFGTSYLTTGTSIIYTSDFSTTASVVDIPFYAYDNNDGGATTQTITDALQLNITSIYTGTATTGFDTQFYFAVMASPPASEDSGEPPLPKSTTLGYLVIDADGLTGTASKRVTNKNAIFVPYELSLLTKWADAGSPFSAPASLSNTTPRVFSPTRRGVTYQFQIYAGIYRSSTSTWYVQKVGTKTGLITQAQKTLNAVEIVTDTFTTVTAKTNSRIKYATLSVSGATATTHTTFTASQPALEYVAAVCDLEMGARTDGGKAIFGITKPTGGATYGGNFTLKLNIAPTALSTISLRYPDNINYYGFDPGYSRVRNNILVVPNAAYLAGQSGVAAEGVIAIGATASDTASMATYGEIPLIAAKGGLVTAEVAQREANRLKSIYSVANTKSVSLRIGIDSIELWDGWDVGDSININIQHGIVSVNEAFVISGVRWFAESAGNQRFEFELVQGSSFRAAKA